MSDTYQKEQKERLTRMYDALPDAFKARIDFFRNATNTFKYNFESYELFVCQEAAKLTERFPDKQSLKDYIKKLSESTEPFDAKELSRSHSENSLIAMCRLALIYVDSPEQLPTEHGALCGLTKCAEYGCFNPHNALLDWMNKK